MSSPKLLGSEGKNHIAYILVIIYKKEMYHFFKTGSFSLSLRSVLFNFQICGDFPDIFLLLISNLNQLWSENIFCIIRIILSVFRFVLWPRIWINLGVSCVYERIYSLFYRVLDKCQSDQVGWRCCSKFLYLYWFLST